MHKPTSEMMQHILEVEKWDMVRKLRARGVDVQESDFVFIYKDGKSA
jgi:hypothetical protein